MKRHIKIVSSLPIIFALFIASNASADEWTGAYVGGHVGYGFQSDKGGENLVFDTNLDGEYGDTVRTGAGANAFSPGFCGGAPNGNNAGAGCKKDDDGGLDAGLRAGYDWSVSGLVAGVLVEGAFVDAKDSVTGFSTTPAAYAFKREINNILAVRGRVGKPVDKYLVYGTAGIARADLDHSFSTTNTANSFTPSNSGSANGYQVGLGVERKGSGRISYGLEYLYTSLEDDGYTVRVGPGTAPPTNPFLLVNAAGTDMRRGSEDLNLHSVRFTMSYRFSPL